ncbi:MAG: hypothetical protein OCU12_07830 [Methanophagales archaeon]|nr:hypothetical protein [Methanophagales archaeon]
MGWYYSHYKNCEFCGEEFEASRRDAKFCSAKCRTAASRRQKKREQAKKTAVSIWDAYTVNARTAILQEYHAADDMIADLQNEYGLDAAAQAIKITFVVMQSVLDRMEERIRNQQMTIDDLKEYKTAVQEIEKITRMF